MRPIADLSLSLTGLEYTQAGSEPVVSAHATLKYEVMEGGEARILTSPYWQLAVPLDALREVNLHWYFERWTDWPSRPFRARARAVEQEMRRLGRLLYRLVFTNSASRAVGRAWRQAPNACQRQFSVHVRSATPAGQPGTHQPATWLLGLPWELLHDGRGFLLPGRRATSVRRSVEALRRGQPATSNDSSIRILLVAPRPEDDSCAFYDHRSAARALFEVVQSAGRLFDVQILTPPTLAQLRQELTLAREAGHPFHIVHFDGHGGYDLESERGLVCFEDPQDVGRPEVRRHVRVYTEEWAPLLTAADVSLVLLDACHTATAQGATESIASELVRGGVESVVAMSHSVMIETARRFTAAFYASLARGDSVAESVLAGQCALKADSRRGHVQVAGPLRLLDWFVPVLYQRQVTSTWLRRIKKEAALAIWRNGTPPSYNLPEAPIGGFIGRSRELMVAERLLHTRRNIVIRGLGGEGKTTLAVELARWLVLTNQFEAACFVSLARCQDARSLVDEVGRQLGGARYAAAACPTLDDALLTVRGALNGHSTLILIDSVEASMAPPYLDEVPRSEVNEQARYDLSRLLSVCAELMEVGATRIIFMAREKLPAPFDAPLNELVLGRLDLDDAVRLLEAAMSSTAVQPHGIRLTNVTQRDAEDLAENVHCHAQTLMALVPSLRKWGFKKTRRSYVELIRDMERRFPRDPELQLFASVSISLQRLSPAHRKQIRVLAMFSGRVDLIALEEMMGWQRPDVESLSSALIAVGLAERDAPYRHLTLHPTLCPLLAADLAADEQVTLRESWTRATLQQIDDLVHLRRTDPEAAAALTRLEIPNFFALLGIARSLGSERTLHLTTMLQILLMPLRKARLLDQIALARRDAAASLGRLLTHSAFQAARGSLERYLSEGGTDRIVPQAQALLARAEAAGRTAYPGALFDLAVARFLMGRSLHHAGSAADAIPWIDSARATFLAEPEEGEANSLSLEMASKCLSEKGDCLLTLDQVELAREAYTQRVKEAREAGDLRGVALGQFHVASIWQREGRHAEALEYFAAARDNFERWGEKSAVAMIWQETGRVLEASGALGDAEDAFRAALTIRGRLSDSAGQGAALSALGSLYSGQQRYREAIHMYGFAMRQFRAVGDHLSETLCHHNLAVTLLAENRLDEARIAIYRATAIGIRFGARARPWESFETLSLIERAAGDIEAAARATDNAVQALLTHRRSGGGARDASLNPVRGVLDCLQRGDIQDARRLLSLEALAAGISGLPTALHHALASLAERNLKEVDVQSPELSTSMRAEILWCFERIEASAAREKGGLAASTAPSLESDAPQSATGVTPLT